MLKSKSEDYLVRIQICVCVCTRVCVCVCVFTYKTIYITLMVYTFIQMTVLLMDCEGENDMSGDANVDNLVTFISLQIASVQLINVEKQIGLSDLTRLNVSFVTKQECISRLNVSFDSKQTRMYFIKAIGQFTQKRCLAKKLVAH